MALGTMTILNRSDRDEVMMISISVVGDGAYPAGGTPDFTDALQAAITAAAAAATDKNIRGAETVEIIDIIPGYCGFRYEPRYDSVNDKLVIIDTNAAPHIDAAPGDLSGTTFYLTCVCK